MNANDGRLVSKTFENLTTEVMGALEECTQCLFCDTPQTNFVHACMPMNCTELTNDVVNRADKGELNTGSHVMCVTCFEADKQNRRAKTVSGWRGPPRCWFCIQECTKDETRHKQCVGVPMQRFVPVSSMDKMATIAKEMKDASDEIVATQREQARNAPGGSTDARQVAACEQRINREMRETDVAATADAVVNSLEDSGMTMQRVLEMAQAVRQPANTTSPATNRNDDNGHEEEEEEEEEETNDNPPPAPPPMRRSEAKTRQTKGGTTPEDSSKRRRDTNADIKELAEIFETESNPINKYVKVGPRLLKPIIECARSMKEELEGVAPKLRKLEFLKKEKAKEARDKDTWKRTARATHLKLANAIAVLKAINPELYTEEWLIENKIKYTGCEAPLPLSEFEKDD